jgi:hypothetical protein
MPLSAQSKDGASAYPVESGAAKLSKLPLSASSVLRLHYCAKEQPQRPSLCNTKTEPQSIVSKAVRANRVS